MSLHAKTPPELIEKLNNQRRNGTITSIVIAVLIVLLLGIIMFWFLIPGSIKLDDGFVLAPPAKQEKETITPPKPVRTVSQTQKTPAASPSIAKALARESISAISIPVSAKLEPIESEGFGENLGLGTGWGNADFGHPSSILSSPVSAERVVYVIDYSMSLKGAKETIMKNELAKSIKNLPSGTQFQVILFAGPAWVAGDKVDCPIKAKDATVIDPSGYEYKWLRGKTASDWSAKGKKRTADWLVVSKDTISEATETVRNTELVWGTIWEPALEMAMDMNPRPQAIVFMTDGVTGGNPEKIAHRLGSEARRKGITISAVALMEPKAKDAMAALAKETNGSFAIINSKGEVEATEDFSKK